MFKVQNNVVQFFIFSKNLSFGKFLGNLLVRFHKPKHYQKQWKKKLFLKIFKLLQNFDKTKLSRTNILLSFKTTIIVSNGSIFF
jgi:hypothetical protein